MLRRNLQRADRGRFQWRALGADHQRFQHIGMLVEPVRSELAQSLARRPQPLPSSPGLELIQHFATHAHAQAEGAGQADQQEIDQHRGPYLPDDFSLVLGRQHPQPTGECGHVHEEQRLVAQHHQAFGNRLG
ncbi:hypothetical protein SRABI112_03443 [Pseudomonas mediterranea]|nr:hypothetical protein SRABI112_03443 [Pseudomonas mediterranea]